MPIKKRIVIFDDDANIAEIVRHILDDDEWEVFPFSDCKNIIYRITTIDPSVIIMDNWLPVTGGVAATQLLKSSEHLKHIPIILVTANNHVSALSAEAGADAYLAKPFDIDDMEELILAHSL